MRQQATFRRSTVPGLSHIHAHFLHIVGQLRRPFCRFWTFPDTDLQISTDAFSFVMFPDSSKVFSRNWRARSERSDYCALTHCPRPHENVLHEAADYLSGQLPKRHATTVPFQD
uniref:(northern house mosquito) hypothetical protein n=1 Tax=Culex pipiens TaxID=7175 RepID=A0A8D8AJB1_CULPI